MGIRNHGEMKKMTGHWLLELIGQLVLCFLGAVFFLVFAWRVGLFDYGVGAEIPFLDVRRGKNDDSD